MRRRRPWSSHVIPLLDGDDGALGGGEEGGHGPEWLVFTLQGCQVTDYDQLGPTKSKREIKGTVYHTKYFKK